MGVPLMNTFKAAKLGLPMSAAMNGVRIFVTSAVMTAPNPPPITTATARSMTFPRTRNCLKPLNMGEDLLSCSEEILAPKDREIGSSGNRVIRRLWEFEGDRPLEYSSTKFQLPNTALANSQQPAAPLKIVLNPPIGIPTFIVFWAEWAYHHKL